MEHRGDGAVPQCERETDVRTVLLRVAAEGVAVVANDVAGVEGDNFLGASEPDPELDRGTLEHPRLSPIGPEGRGARLLGFP